MASIPKKVIERFSTELRKYQRVLENAKKRDVNEADTVAIVGDILASVFGFDKYAEITSEYSIRGTYCDLALKVDGNVRFLVEVKAIGLDLKENHLRQTVNYGAQHGVEWVVLTNGIAWEVYRIIFEQPIQTEQVCRINFLELNHRKHDHQDKLFLLCREGLTKAAIEEFHEHVKSVNRFIIGAIITNSPALDTIRRELKRLNPSLKVTNEEIENILRSEVLKRDVLEGENAKNAASKIKKASGRVLRKRQTRKTKPDVVNTREGIFRAPQPPKNDD